MASRHRHRRHRRRNSRERSVFIAALQLRYRRHAARALIRENKDLSEPESGEATMYSTEPVFRGHARLLINLSLVSEER